MNKLPARGRADLLALLREPTEDREAVAALLGYERVRPDFPSGDGQPENPEPVKVTGDFDDTGPDPEPVIPTFPRERPRYQFIVPTTYEALQPYEKETKSGNPISDAELEVDWGAPLPPLAPLTPWSRLGIHLKRRLGVVRPGRRLDLRRLMRLAGTGLPLTALPRLTRVAWAPRILVLWDISEEMLPFVPDVRQLIARLTREQGRQGLVVREIRTLPTRLHVARISPETPVLAVSSLGQYRRCSHTADSWSWFARHLAWLGHPFQALTPCPVRQWNPDLAARWRPSLWDRHTRFGGGGHHPTTSGLLDHSPHDSEVLVDRLLTLLSPASRVSLPLLRQARLLLGPSTDVGTEWEAWHHTECWRSRDCFGFHPGPAYEERLQRLASEQDTYGAALRALTETLSAHHAQVSWIVSAEAELRAGWALGGHGGTLAGRAGQAAAVIRRVVDRLRDLHVVSPKVKNNHLGLARWFRDFVGRLNPEIRCHSAVHPMVAEGLACAHILLDTAIVQVPAGIEPSHYQRILQSLGTPGGATDWRLGMTGEGIWLQPSTGDAMGRPFAQTVIPARDHSALVERADGTAESSRFDPAAAPIRLSRSIATGPLTVSTDLAKRAFAPTERPAWASRMWYDRFGLAAEFKIDKIPFVLRWIPPGRFLMGSPEDEPGRRNDEGPQHEVTISRGFWMGETPVTQSQWRAVVETADASPSLLRKLFGKIGAQRPQLRTLFGRDSLDPAPSRFSGRADAPVENVSYEDSEAFCNLVTVHLSKGPGFHLPTEAQWEYACRAGTGQAFNDGSPCTLPAGKDQALDRLGWFVENSGNETKEVKAKMPNTWGLYDCHGNVWEWCRDGMRTYRDTPELDPVGPLDGDTRVMRGGSWGNRAQFCRAALRSQRHPVYRWYYLGLRLAAGQPGGPGAAEPPGAERPQ